MRIINLSLLNYRSYKNLNFTLSPKTNIFVGNNGVGKTNILESIYCLSVARSYKAKDKDMILYGNEFYKIGASVEKKNGTEKLLLIGSTEGKKAFSNDVLINKLGDFIGKFNAVLFSPEDLLLLKNGPVERRKLMDLSLLQLSKQYVEDYSNWKKHLKLRNDYLKYMKPKNDDLEIINDEMLDILTDNFMKFNNKIYSTRISFIKELEEKVSVKYKELSGNDDEIKIEYIINFENDIEFYKKKYKSDITQGSTYAGCQKDDLVFYKNNENFETSSSQGEQRMLSLSIKLAIAEMIYETKKESPVVLLDDVFSELDKNHQNRLLNMLPKDIQVIITTTDIIKIGKTSLENAKVFEVSKGFIKEL